MPTYVYECSTCQKTFEVEQRITEDALKDCQCGAQGTLKRLMQPIAVMFKGAGFHINDYASSSARAEKPEAAPTKSDAAPASSGDAAATSTPAPTPEPASAPKTEA